MSTKRRIEVVAYDPSWPQKYEAEAANISAVFRPQLLAIHHIGSTAIPGMWAKPIIDIMPLVREIEAVDALNPALIESGYQPKGENGIPGRRYFQKGGDVNRSHHVHVYEPDNPEVARHLDFRDYLIAHPRAAEQYAGLKRELARRFRRDIASYTEGKSVFIQEVIQNAQAWRSMGGVQGPGTQSPKSLRARP